MTKRLDSNITPLHKDKYYVYALFKPNDVNPFYVGKGIRGRINEHFKESNLKGNSPKISVIKKYRNSIRREILCYFDSEEASYKFEEYLIELYGLISEGGCLTNYAKTRFQYSDKFVKEISSIGHLYRERIYTKDVIERALTMFYVENLTTDIISKTLNIPENYLGYVLRGEKCKYDYIDFKSKYPKINFDKILVTLKKNRQSRAHTDNKTDSLIIEVFEAVCNKQMTVVEAAEIVGISDKSLSEVFLGKSRPYLNLDYERYKSIEKGRGVPHLCILKEVALAKSYGMSVADIVKKTGYGRTTVYRALKELAYNAA